MTSLLSWAGVDERDTASLYLVSDSRLTWSGGAAENWDYGRKLFASRNHPDIFGYCGQVLFPSLLIGQILDLVDRGGVFTANTRPEEKNNRVLSVIERSFETYPHKHEVEILHCSRAGTGMDSEFFLYNISWNGTEWERQEIEMPESSGTLMIRGSGEQSLKKHLRRWESSDVGGTSRSIYSAFCDSLLSGEDPYTGGAPQLVGLYREGAGHTYGVILEAQGYVNGLPVQGDFDMDVFEWRNELFEVCDSETMERKPDAQVHHRPFDRS